MSERYKKAQKKAPGRPENNKTVELESMSASESTLSLDLGSRIRRHFPLLTTSDVVYLDTAASAQKPEAVLEAVDGFYRKSYANIHRGVYQLSEEATARYDSARQRVASFIGAGKAEEIVFTPGATQSVNLVANAWGRENLKPGDEIVLSILEHHANIVPWQMIAAETGAKLKFVRLTSNSEFDFEEFCSLLSEKTKLIACTQLSNALGVSVPIEKLILKARERDILVLVDASQAVTHFDIDVGMLDVDFLVFSGHKLYGPTGIGVLYAKEELLEAMPPFLGGGDMIREVRIEGTEYADIPMKFEAGTPNIAGAIGLAAAIEFVDGIGFASLQAHESQLLQALEGGLSELEGVRLLGPQGKRTGLVSMVFEGAHSLDVAQLLASKNIAVRAGHHCAQPLMDYLGVQNTLRASLGVYSTPEDVESFVAAVSRILGMLRQ